MKTPIQHSKSSPDKSKVSAYKKNQKSSPEKHNQSIYNCNPLDSPFDPLMRIELHSLSEQHESDPSLQLLESKIAHNQNEEQGQYSSQSHHPHYHSAAVTKLRRRRVSNQSSLANVLQTKSPQNASSKQKQLSCNSVLYNQTYTENNTPLHARHGTKDISRYFNTNSLSNLSSIDCAINLPVSRFSGITDDFRAEDFQNQHYVDHSKNISSNLQNSRKKNKINSIPLANSSQTNLNNPVMNVRVNSPTPIVRGYQSSITPSFKNQLEGNPYCRYDMNERIAKHSKINNEKQHEAGFRKAITESDEQGRLHNFQSFQKIFTSTDAPTIDADCFQDINEQKAYFEHLDQNGLSEGVEYRTGGVGISNSDRSDRDYVDDNMLGEDQRINNAELNALKLDALQVFSLIESVLNKLLTRFRKTCFAESKSLKN